MEFGFWILDFGFWILDFGFWILDLGFWILDFGFWILDFGFWSLDFGFWILDQFSIRSFCGGPKRRRLDFGFWILDFGLDEALPDIVWILHKIFPCHADSGRRIYHKNELNVGEYISYIDPMGFFLRHWKFPLFRNGTGDHRFRRKTLRPCVTLLPKALREVVLQRMIRQVTGRFCTPEGAQAVNYDQ